MNLKPLSDLIIVQPADPEERIGSFILAKSSQEEAKHGTVLAVGPGKQMESGWIEPMDIRVGDTVLYSQYAKEKFKHNGLELLTMHQADIIGILDQ